MADRKITDHSALTGAGSASTDLVEVVDVSDTTDAASGTNKKMTLAELAAGVATHGALATDAELASHEADTTSVHGITDTSTLYRAGGTDVAVADGGTGASNASGARTALGLVIGTDVEAHDADLTTFAGLTPSNDDVLQRKAGAWANRTIAQLLADLAAAGTTFQPLDAELTAVAGLTSAADKAPYFTGSGTAALMTVTSFIRTLLDDADAATARTTLGVKPPTQQVFTSGSGTYNLPAGCTAILVEIVGGGGAGGSADGGSSQAGVGGGGAAGGFVRKFISSPSSSYAYAVGSGGTAAAAGNNAGGDGADSTFGASITAKAGGGGFSQAAGTSASVVPGGVKGSGTTGGDIVSDGEPGGWGIRLAGNSCRAGTGGNGPWGGGGRGNDAGDGGAGGAPGAGGGGGGSTTTTDRQGGAGSAGIIVVTEYYG